MSNQIEGIILPEILSGLNIQIQWANCEFIHFYKPATILDACKEVGNWILNKGRYRH